MGDKDDKSLAVRVEKARKEDETFRGLLSGVRFDRQKHGKEMSIFSVCFFFFLSFFFFFLAFSLFVFFCLFLSFFLSFFLFPSCFFS